jgi:large subunit ribosomal protein L1
MSAHGKRYNEARATIDRETNYSPAEALKILKALPNAKFDETIEAHFRLGLNVRHADQQLRGTLMLPHGTGKSVRVAVFAEGDKAREAEEAGADVVGAPTWPRRSRAASPTSTSRLRRLTRWATSASSARARPPRPDAEPEDGYRHVRRGQGGLGRQGRQARVPHRPRRERPRLDREEELRRDGPARELRALVEEIVRAKPASAKGRYIHQITLATTMGPAFASTRPGFVGSSRNSSRRPFRPRFFVLSPSPKKGSSSRERTEVFPRWRLDRRLSPLSEPASVRARSLQGGERCTKVTRSESSQSWPRGCGRRRR